MEVTSYLHRSGSPAQLLLGALNQFGGFAEMAQQFGVQQSTVERWFRGGGRIPGADIRAEMQNYLPGQQRTFIITGTNAEAREVHPVRDRRLEITMNREDNIQYQRMLAEGKPEAARVFLLAAEHGQWDGVPALAGAEWYPEDEDYYDDDDYEYDTDYILV